MVISFRFQWLDTIMLTLHSCHNLTQVTRKPDFMITFRSFSFFHHLNTRMDKFCVIGQQAWGQREHTKDQQLIKQRGNE